VVFFIVLAAAATLMYPNDELKSHKPEQGKKKVEAIQPSFLKEMFCNKIFLFLLMGGFFEAFGYYIPFFFINSYAIEQGIGEESAALILGLMNGSSGIGRIFLGSVADSFGFVNCFVYCMSVATASIFVWTICKTEWAILLFALIFGFHVGGYISLQAPLVATLFGVKRIGGAVGVLYSIGVPGNLLGGVIGGYITDVNRPNWIPTILFSGSMYLVYVALLIPVWLESRKTIKGSEEEGLLKDYEAHEESFGIAYNSEYEPSSSKADVDLSPSNVDLSPTNVDLSPTKETK